MRGKWFSCNGLVGRIGGALTCMRSAVSSDMSTVQFELALRSWMLIRGHFGSSDRLTPFGQVFVPRSLTLMKMGLLPPRSVRQLAMCAWTRSPWGHVMTSVELVWIAGSEPAPTATEMGSSMFCRSSRS